MKIFRILGYFVALLSPMSQIYMAFAIYYLSVGLIYTDMDMVDFVQNFAGFYIILEFDNYVIKFLHNIEFYSMLKRVVNFSKNKKLQPEKSQFKKDEFLEKVSNVSDFSNSKFRSVLKKMIKDTILKKVLTEESFVGEEQDLLELENHKIFILIMKIFLLGLGFIVCLCLFFSRLQ